MTARIMLFPTGGLIDLTKTIEAAGYTVRVSAARAVAIGYPSREIPEEKETEL